MIPGNAVLPPHKGIIITRGLQEWACLLPQDLPFVSVARLLGWQTHDPAILSDTTIRSLVRLHGQIIREAEQAEVAAMVTRDNLAALELNLGGFCLTPQKGKLGQLSSQISPKHVSQKV
ncbi:MAG TPA: hypothetical protein VLA19_10175, partial [Herpetosiphonaceae bacterium]|nr:hypothetical protein [Herpetosiphonaceae bacterium]